MNCTDCIEVKDKPLTYKRCIKCGKWCKLEPQEKVKIARRKQ